MIDKKRIWIVLAIVIVTAGMFFVKLENIEIRDEQNKETNTSSSLDKQDATNKLQIYSNDTNSEDVIIANYEVLGSSEAEYEDLSFVGSETYNIIDEIYNNIDFWGIFKHRDLDNNDFFRERYYKLVIGDECYSNMKGEKGVLIDSYEYDILKKEEYTYYFFDIDKDQIPELVVSDTIRFAYIFKLEIYTDEIKLLHTFLGRDQMLGDNKIGFYHAGVGSTYGFYELDRNGEPNIKINFYSASYYNNNTQQEDEIYMVGFVEQSDEFKTYKEYPKETREQIYFDELTRTNYFKITKKQYNQLTKQYFDSEKVAKENIKEVTYTFDELFGDFEERNSKH